MKGNSTFWILFSTKKQTWFPWNFLETPIQNKQSFLSSLFQCTLFLMFPLFQKCLNPHVRTNKTVNSVVCPPFSSRVAQGYFFSYFFKLYRALSLSRMLVELVYSIMLEKKIKFMVFTFLENALNLGVFILAHVPYSKLQTSVFENLFPPTTERGGGKLWFSF